MKSDDDDGNKVPNGDGGGDDDAAMASHGTKNTLFDIGLPRNSRETQPWSSPRMPP